MAHYSTNNGKPAHQPDIEAPEVRCPGWPPPPSVLSSAERCLEWDLALRTIRTSMAEHLEGFPGVACGCGPSEMESAYSADRNRTIS